MLNLVCVFLFVYDGFVYAGFALSRGFYFQPCLWLWAWRFCPSPVFLSKIKFALKGCLQSMTYSKIPSGHVKTCLSYILVKRF